MMIGDALDRLAGLVHRRIGDRHHVLEADGDGERAVLGQVQVLAGHRRHDDPQGLGQHDLAQHGAAAQAERTRGLPLAERHGLDAGSHDLGDIGGCIDDQAEQQGEEFRADGAAALEVEAVQFGTSRSQRRAHGEPDGGRECDQRRERHRPGPWAATGCLLATRAVRCQAITPKMPIMKASSTQVSAGCQIKLREP